MKTKSYLHVIVTTHNGTTFNNHLMLSEVHLISKLLNDNASIHVSKHKVSASYYKSIFNQ